MFLNSLVTIFTHQSSLALHQNYLIVSINSYGGYEIAAQTVAWWVLLRPPRFSNTKVKSGLNVIHLLTGLARMVLVLSGACASRRVDKVVLYASTRSDNLGGGRVVSRGWRMPRVNLETLIDFMQLKENWDKGVIIVMLNAACIEWWRRVTSIEQFSLNFSIFSCTLTYILHFLN